MDIWLPRASSSCRRRRRLGEIFWSRWFKRGGSYCRRPTTSGRKEDHLHTHIAPGTQRETQTASGAGTEVVVIAAAAVQYFYSFWFVLVNSLRESLEHVIVWQVITYLGFESQDNSIAVMLFIFVMTMTILRCAVIMVICGSRISWCCPRLTQSFFFSKVLKEADPALKKFVQRSRFVTSGVKTADVCLYGSREFRWSCSCFLRQRRVRLHDSAVSDFNVELIVARTEP